MKILMGVQSKESKGELLATDMELESSETGTVNCLGSHRSDEMTVTSSLKQILGRDRPYLILSNFMERLLVSRMWRERQKISQEEWQFFFKPLECQQLYFGKCPSQDCDLSCFWEDFWIVPHLGGGYSNP
ncbi:PREDICTED: uncharacterized protein LOC104586331 [Nelumbo nucifera]|uniref:Uncharacterized protein LOC104586331 n=1 Tax=Nelumbo nucifera TaxID=4432 RepID=A0A1U7YVC6_NELNU|nr:PREDICTED: uncharacterized protein LOC104586331 [Nelumbo nucifera]